MDLSYSVKQHARCHRFAIYAWHAAWPGTFQQIIYPPHHVYEVRYLRIQRSQHDGVHESWDFVVLGEKEKGRFNQLITKKKPGYLTYMKRKEIMA